MPFALAGTQRQYERPRPFRMLHLALSLALDPAQRSVSGTARLDFERVDPDAGELRLDAVGFEIQSVLLKQGRRRAESPARHEYDGNAITVSVQRSVERVVGLLGSSVAPGAPGPGAGARAEARSSEAGQSR